MGQRHRLSGFKNVVPAGLPDHPLGQVEGVHSAGGIAAVIKGRHGLSSGSPCKILGHRPANHRGRSIHRAKAADPPSASARGGLNFPLLRLQGSSPARGRSSIPARGNSGFTHRIKLLLGDLFEVMAGGVFRQPLGRGSHLRASVFLGVPLGQQSAGLPLRLVGLVEPVHQEIAISVCIGDVSRTGQVDPPGGGSPPDGRTRRSPGALGHGWGSGRGWAWGRAVGCAHLSTSLPDGQPGGHRSTQPLRLPAPLH